MSEDTPSSSSSSTAPPLFSFTTKLIFFNRIRRLLQSKSVQKRSSQPLMIKPNYNTKTEQFIEPGDQPPSTSPQPETTLAEACKTDDMDEVLPEEESKKLASGGRSGGDAVMIMRKAVKELLFGKWEEKENAIMEVKKLAKEDMKVRKELAELGVVPALVEIVVDSDVVERRLSAVQALVELADGTFANKAMIVEAGILSRLPTNINTLGEPTIQYFAQLLLSISTLSNTQFLPTTTRLLPFLINIFDSESTSSATKDICLGTIYNLSSVIENAGPLITHGVMDILLNMSSKKEVSEKALATLGNLVVTLMGKKAMEDHPMVPQSLIEILAWEDKPKCQELSTYILMILAHQNVLLRQKMARLGIVTVLLEVALLGSPLAQKRTLKLLQWFKNERQERMGPHSGPQSGQAFIGSLVNERESSEGKKLMKKMVKQSLNKNLEAITRRANAAGESSNLKSLIISSSSKSLPY